MAEVRITSGVETRCIDVRSIVRSIVASLFTAFNVSVNSETGRTASTSPISASIAL